MTCAACGRDLPSAFPGAVVTCACGAAQTLAAPAARASSVPGSGGPYRAASALPTLEGEVRCPYCGNGCPALVRVCPHCDVRLESVRCVRCYSLQTPGSFACGRCGQALELEPVLDATDAPCPRCMTPLEAGGHAVPGDDPRVHECPRCGGMFVPKPVLAEILARAEVEGPFRQTAPAKIPPLDEVRYLSCPQCKTSMNRVNFGKSSAVIVDVCRKHGTWFDAGELTRVVLFAAGGGLARLRAREAEEKRAESVAIAQARAEVMSLTAREEARLAGWRDFLNELFFW